MFSMEQKKQIADAVEKVLLSFNHPEMPTENPYFYLRVEGKDSWSWADIKPNWTFTKENPPSVNPFNESVAEEMKIEEPNSVMAKYLCDAGYCASMGEARRIWLRREHSRMLFGNSIRGEKKWLDIDCSIKYISYSLKIKVRDTVDKSYF